MRNTWTTFGPDPPLSALPPDFVGCLPPNKPSQACDGIVGSSTEGAGYCASAPYNRTTYCACVNNSVACPGFSMTSCSNSAYAYQPWAWFQKSVGGGPSKNEQCAASPICVNLVEVGGSQNVVSGVTQQCGTVENITKVLKEDPVLSALAFLLIIAFIVVLSMRADDNGEDAPPLAPPTAV